MRSIRIYDQGYRIALLYKEGRKYDYAITLSTPLRRTRLKKGDYVYKIFSIPDFMVKLKERVLTSNTQIANEIKELVGL